MSPFIAERFTPSLSPSSEAETLIKSDERSACTSAMYSARSAVAVVSSREIMSAEDTLRLSERSSFSPPSEMSPISAFLKVIELLLTPKSSLA